MKCLEELNQKWKEWFQKNRIELVTKYSHLFIDFLEKLEIRDVFWVGGTEWAVEIHYIDKIYTFEVDDDGCVYTSPKISFKNDESYELRNILNDDFEITTYIQLMKEERQESAYKKAKMEQIGLKIKSVSKNEDGSLIYVLENGDTLIVRII